MGKWFNTDKSISLLLMPCLAAIENRLPLVADSP